MSFDPINNLTITRGIGLDNAVRQFEQWFIWWSLEKNSFNQSRTADELKIHRNSLVNRIHDWGWAQRVQEGAAGKKVLATTTEGESSEGALMAGQGPTQNKRAGA